MTIRYCNVCKNPVVSIDADGDARPCGHSVFPTGAVDAE